jgi:hypothetical protein
VLLAALLAGTLARAECAFAAVTPVHYYRLGSVDPGAAAGSPGANPTLDSVGKAHLTRFGEPVYVESMVSGDTLGVDFANSYGGVHGSATQYYANATVVFAPADPANWGMEAWISFDTLPPADSGQSEVTAFHVGDLGAGSLLLQTTVVDGQSRWAVQAPGLVSFAGSSEVQPGAWTHVAVVNNDGTLQLYVNGTLEGEESAGILEPRGGITLGAAYYNGLTARRYARGMDGKIAEARLFEFAPGEFDPQTDLLYPQLP